MIKKYYVYELYTSIEGVFYVGSGVKSRVNGTKQIRSNPPYSRKELKLQEYRDRSIKVYVEIVYECDSKYEAKRVEENLIEQYGNRITNDRKSFNDTMEYAIVLVQLGHSIKHVCRKYRINSTDLKKHLKNRGIKIVYVKNEPPRNYTHIRYMRLVREIFKNY